MNRKDFNHNALQGIDVSIEISLKEYGFAFIKSEKETLFYYGVKVQETECKDIEYIKFDFSTMNNDTDILEEYNWIKLDDILSFIGLTKEEFLNQSLQQKINDLLSYYGYENIFGSSYGECLTYDDITNN